MKKVLYAVGVVIIDFVIWKFSGMVIDFYITDTFLNLFISEAVLAALALVSLIMLRKLFVLRFKLCGIKEGLAVGAVDLAISSICLLSFAFNHEPITVSSFSIFLFVVEMFLVGFAEEVLFRGIIQNELQNYFKCDSVNSARKAIIASGILFGSAHLMNAGAGIGIIPVLIQVAVVIPTGIIISAAYFRSRNNLWVCILIHSISDLSGFLNTGVLNGTTQSSAIASYSGIKLPIAAVYLGIALFLIRKSKIREIVDIGITSSLYVQNAD